ncbi:MAG TPA: hypothetical protein VMS94_02080 [Acidobacteriota bacterium]|nr:hypothetical protein [Acidobacteriota bacterium]
MLEKRKRTSVSIPYQLWEKLANYFDENQNELAEKGIKSLSKLASVWIEEGLLRVMAIEEGYLKAGYKK